MAPYSNHLRQYYDEAAINYHLALELTYGMLAHHLYNYAKIGHHEMVLDIGTGSGVVARQIQKTAAYTIGCDFSRSMLKAAKGTLNHLVQADVHALPFPSNCFSTITAGFVFNSTIPALSFGESYRCLDKGGRLIIFEWGTEDEISATFSNIVSEYYVDKPSKRLKKKRTCAETPLPWDQLETMDDLVQMLQEHQFSRVTADVEEIPIQLASVNEFIRYKLAWPLRQAELQEMNEALRRLCISDLQENIAAYAKPDGSLVWLPNIIRITAFKHS